MAKTDTDPWGVQAIRQETEAIRRTIDALREMSDDELDNEDYTLRHERQFLGLTDDEVAEKRNAVELEKARRRHA